MIFEFEFITDFGTFRDAIHTDDYTVYTEDELTALKLERLDTWLARVNPVREG